MGILENQEGLEGEQHGGAVAKADKDSGKRDAGSHQPAQVLKLTVPGLPVAQPRQRMTMIAGHPQNYVPRKHSVHDFKAAIRLAAFEKCGPTILGPVALTLRFFFPRPQRLVWRKRAMEQAWHVSKPDLDNLEKSVMDSLTQAGVWRDDAQVCCKRSKKIICAGDEEPRVEIVVRPLLNT